MGCDGRGGVACFWRGRTAPMRTAKSCGPDAPMAGVKFARSLRSLGMTVTNKLWSRRGEHGISRKPLRREGRNASAEPVCSCAFFYLPLHMRPRVQRAPGLPCVPLGIAPASLYLLGADEFAKPRADAVARMLTFVIVRLDRTIQYSATPAMESRTRGVLDPPVKPGDDGGGGES